MAGKKIPKKPINFYWIYAIVGVALISLNLFNWQGGNSVITPSEFETMVVNGDVNEVVVVNRKMAKVYLNPEALENEPHNKKIKKPYC